jgi:hypothetical protein
LRWGVIKNLWAIPVLVAALICTFKSGDMGNDRRWIYGCEAGEQSVTARSTMGKICRGLYYFSECIMNFIDGN